ncbi:MAG: hypothetical protein GC191_14955 [Azospirillum sp.]|nr:hypothetical protein [Azospirillum sp.]
MASSPGATASGSAIGAPATASERAAALIELAGRLAELLQQEAAAIAGGGTPNAVGNDRHALIQRYDETARVLRLDRAGLAGLSPELLERLRREARTLAEAAAAHAELLRVASEAQRRTVDGLFRAVNRERTAANGYGRALRGLSPSPARRDTPMLGLDTRL